LGLVATCFGSLFFLSYSAFLSVSISIVDTQRSFPSIEKVDVNKVTKKAKYAVFLQMGTNYHLFEELTQCVRNVAQGLPDNEDLDIHVALLNDDRKHLGSVRQQLTSLLPNINLVSVVLTENAGADVGQFLTQLKKTQEGGINQPIDYYEAILKVHAKSDEEWRRRMTESLCGSPSQVTSILSQMQSQPDIELVAALGTTFGPQTPLNSVYPRIIETYNMSATAPAFDKKTVRRMMDLSRDVGLTGTFTSPKIVAGTSFWIRWRALEVSKWSNSYDSIYKRFTRGYVNNLGLEHVIERLIPSMLTGRIAEITPAPRIFALYFPQYHAFPENDRFWGVNFTEWTLLKPYEPKEGYPPVRKPLPVQEGGLGYYNLLDYDTRKRQADLAKQYGVTGFTFYHYWFSGSHAPDNHLVMTGLFDKLLEDGEPNIPFFLSWANEPWNRRWTGDEGEILLSQEYGQEDEWKEHFIYLLKFFRLPNYEKVNGRPWSVSYPVMLTMTACPISTLTPLFSDL
jgi:lipopolysaccharide biosynthesis protein